MGRKAQITLFIILGIGLLLVIGTGIYVFTTAREAEVPIEEAIVDAPKSAVNLYVDACLQNAVLDGLEIMRMQGGYIIIPEIPYLDDKGDKIPYWLDLDTARIPSLTYFEDVFSDYIEYEVGECVGDFEVFTEQGFTVSIGELNVDTEFFEVVRVDMEYPVEFTKEGETLFIDEFSYIVPVNLELIYNIAADLTVNEDRNAYLEYLTNHMISLYSAVDEDLLPPTSAVRVNTGCSSVDWKVSDAEDTFKDVMHLSLGLLNVKGTSFERMGADDEIAQGVYNSLIYTLFEKDYPNLEIDFSYETEWPMNFNIVPSKGGVVRPFVTRQAGIPFLPMFCVVKYKAAYDITYPVMITITDTESARIGEYDFYPREGFTFKFPVVTYMTRNVPRSSTVYFEEPVLEDSQPLEDLFGVDLEYDITICDELDESKEIEVMDGITKQGLSDVAASYLCGDTECDLGTISYNETLEYPFCRFNRSRILLYKEGYSASEFDIEDDKYFLYPKKKFRAVVYKINIPGYVWSYASTNSLDTYGREATLVEGEEIAVVTLEGAETYTLAAPTMDEIELSPGNYTLTVQLFGQSNVLAGMLDVGGVETEVNPMKGKMTNGIFESEIEITADDMEKSFVQFYVFEEKSSEDLRDASLAELTSSHMQVNGDLKHDGTTITKEQYSDYMGPKFI